MLVSRGSDNCGKAPLSRVSGKPPVRGASARLAQRSVRGAWYGRVEPSLGRRRGWRAIAALPLTAALLTAALRTPGAARAEAPLRVQDDAGHVLTLARPAARVISLAPSLTELLYEAGGGQKMVGAIAYSDYPPAAREVPGVGDNQRWDLERIALLKPDLILVWFHGNESRQLEKLGLLGIPMFFLEPTDIAAIPDALLRIGQLVGSESTATAAAQRFRTTHETLRNTYAGRKPVRVFYQIADKPLLTINNKQIISDVIRLCGGENIFGNLPTLVPQLSTESVVAANPEVILAANMNAPADAERATAAMDEPRLRTWRAFPSLAAVRNRQLWLVPASPISRQGPRILQAAAAVCAALDAARIKH